MLFEKKDKYFYLGIGTIVSFLLAMLTMISLLALIMINFSNTVTSSHAFNDESTFYSYYGTFVCCSMIAFVLVYAIALMENLKPWVYGISFIWLLIGFGLFWSSFGCSLYAYLSVPGNLGAVDKEKRIEKELQNNCCYAYEITDTEIYPEIYSTSAVISCDCPFISISDKCEEDGTTSKIVSKEEICEQRPYYENGFIYPTIYSCLVGFSTIIPLITILLRIFEFKGKCFSKNQDKFNKEFEFQQLHLR